MPTVYARTLRRAAELVGGEDALAIRLGVTPNQLKVWINDLVTPPLSVFAMAAEIISQNELNLLKEKKPDRESPEPDSG